MVDSEKRDTIKKVGLAGLALGLGYGGSELIGHSNDRIDPDKMAASIEEEARHGDNALDEQREWGNTQVDIPAITATVTETGTRDSGATLYEAALTAPLDAPFAITDFDGDAATENVLADRLQADAILSFEALYEVAGEKNVYDRKPHEDAVDHYRVRFTDETGEAAFAIPARDAYELATGTEFDLDADSGDWDLERDNFLQTYMTRFEVYPADDQ